jgi:uncharacterized protein YbjQ (UPF0145 family)
MDPSRITTTDTLPGFRVKKILGSGPILARSAGAGRHIALREALSELARRADELAADAVVGVDMSTSGSEIVLIGMAVLLEPTGPGDSY